MMENHKPAALAADADSIALATATKILGHFVEPIPGVQLKAKIQEAVHSAMASYRPAAPAVDAPKYTIAESHAHGAEMHERGYQRGLAAARAQPVDAAELDDLGKLKALAEAADQGEGQHIYTNWRDSNNYAANDAWHKAASPAVFLRIAALVAQLQARNPELEQDLNDARNQLKAAVQAVRDADTRTEALVVENMSLLRLTAQNNNHVRGAFLNTQGGVTLCHPGREAESFGFAGHLWFHATPADDPAPKLNRYTPAVGRDDRPYMFPVSSGDYVNYADVQALVAQQAARIDELDTVSLIPEGWQFLSADFSRQAMSGAHNGNITLVRDEAGRVKWHALPDDERERDDYPLYAYGSGPTIEEALIDARAKVEGK